MFDFHMHSTVSFDGHDTPEEMVAAALKAGLKEICFTDHIDDDPAGIVVNQRFKVEDYARAYDKLSAEGLKIRRGVELGLLPDNQQNLRTYSNMYPFDFVLGSIHYADGVDVYYEPYWEDKDIFRGERKYLEDTYTCVKAQEDFDVLGHLTYIARALNNPVKRPVSLELHRDVVEEIFKVLIQKGKGIEVNTSGKNRVGAYLPEMEYLQLYKQLGGEIITVGSDAHNAQRVGEHTFAVCEMLRDIFGYVCTFENRKPIFHKL